MRKVESHDQEIFEPAQISSGEKYSLRYVDPI